MRGAELLGIQANAARVALSRLKRDGLISRSARGEYRVAPEAPALHPALARWRELDRHLSPWQGDWLALPRSHRSRTGSPSERRWLRAQRMFGLCRWRNDVYLRPSNLRGGLSALCEGLSRARVEALEDAFVMVHPKLRIDDFYDRPGLDAGYRTTTQKLTRAITRLETLPLEKAAAESFALGAETLRQLAFDPWLPDTGCDSEARRACIEAAKEHDQLARRVWSELLETPMRGASPSAPTQLPTRSALAHRAPS